MPIFNEIPGIMTKRGKELKMGISHNYNIVSGTVDAKNPKSIYINISAWGEPQLEEELNYGRVISNFSKLIKQELFNHLNTAYNEDFFSERTIVDLDMRESGISYGKRSFMNCELTIFQTDDLGIHEDPMINMIQDIINHMVENVFDKSKYFKFNQKKK